MLDFFDTFYTLIHKKNNPFSRYFLYPLLRVPILYFINIFFPLYYRLTSKNEKYKLSSINKDCNRIIVSLTSFPARIDKVWLVIESMLRQVLKPDMIILWLSKEQFLSFDALPENLLKLQKRGLQIRFCNDDLKAHKKYYYSMQEFPDDIVITIDDDTIYHTNLVKYLVELYAKYPATICCCRAWKINSLNGDMLSYNKWSLINKEGLPSFDIFSTGLGGVLYPPHSLYKDVFNVDLFKELCFYADDVWLNVMAHLEGTKYAKTEYSSHFLPIKFKNRTRLRDMNITESANDIQINNLRDHYKKVLDKDPYSMLFN